MGPDFNNTAVSNIIIDHNNPLKAHMTVVLSILDCLFHIFLLFILCIIGLRKKEKKLPEMLIHT